MLCVVYMIEGRLKRAVHLEKVINKLTQLKQTNKNMNAFFQVLVIVLFLCLTVNTKTTRLQILRCRCSVKDNLSCTYRHIGVGVVGPIRKEFMSGKRVSWPFQNNDLDKK